MIELMKDLWVGSLDDFLYNVWIKSEWVFIHAAKEPYHRKLLGYTGRSAPKDHPEYLLARRGDELFLNLIDAPKKEYIPNSIITESLKFIDEQLLKKKKVFIHCNLGESRAPSIALMYMVSKSLFRPTENNFVEEFKKIYPKYNPGSGMYEYVKQFIQVFFDMQNQMKLSTKKSTIIE